MGTADILRTDGTATDQVPVYQPGLGATNDPAAYARIAVGNLLSDYTVTPKVADTICKDGPWVDVRGHATLAAAITAAVGKTLLIPSAVTVSTNTTIPSTVTVQFLHGGSFVRSGTPTLTIEGKYKASDYAQVFSGWTSGLTLNACQLVTPEHFGGVAGDTGDQKTPIDSAFAAASMVYFQGLYRVVTPLATVAKQTWWLGRDKDYSGIHFMPSTTSQTLLTINNGTNYIRTYMRNLKFYGDASTAGSNAVDLNYTALEMDSCQLTGFLGKALRIRAGIDITIRNTKIAWSGILISQESGGTFTTTLRVLSSYLGSTTSGGNGVELRHFYNVYFGENTVFESIQGHAVYVDNTYAFQSSLQMDSPYFKAIDGSLLYVAQTGGQDIAHIGIRGMTIGDGNPLVPYVYLHHVQMAEISVNRWAESQGSAIVETTTSVGKVFVRCAYENSTITGTARADSTAYALSDRIKVTATIRGVSQDRYWICTTAGTSASSQPGGYATLYSTTVTDGTAVFRLVSPVTPGSIYCDTQVDYTAGNVTRVSATSGVGSPEGNVYAYGGSTYKRTDGGTGTSLYVKETAAFGATGWVANAGTITIVHVAPSSVLR